MTKQNRTTNLSVLLLLLVIVLCASYLLRMDNQVPQLEYSQIRQLFEQEKVESVTFPDEHTLELHLREKVKSLGDTDTVRYRIYDFAIFYEDLNDLIVEQKAAGIITSYDYPAAPTIQLADDAAALCAGGSGAGAFVVFPDRPRPGRRHGTGQNGQIRHCPDPHPDGQGPQDHLRGCGRCG